MSLDFSLFETKQVVEEHYVFDINITHNLTGMADAAGIYNALWRSRENGYFYDKHKRKPMNLFMGWVFDLTHGV